MKQLFTLLFLFSGMFVMAQDEEMASMKVSEYPYNIEENVTSFFDGNVPAYTLSVEDATLQIMEDVCKQYMKDNDVKFKRNRKTKEYEAKGFRLPGAEQSADLFITFGSYSEGASITTAYKIGKDDYVNHESDLEANVNQMLKELAKDAKVEGIGIELETEEKILKDFEKELKKLKSDQDKLESTISKCKKDNQEGERDLDQLGNDKKRLLDLLSPSDDESGLTYTTDQLDDFRKDLKKIEKKEKSTHKAINKCLEKISESESNLPVNADEQVAAAQKIELQREAVSKVQGRLQKAISE